jgi:hypothetical protein
MKSGTVVTISQWYGSLGYVDSASSPKTVFWMVNQLLTSWIVVKTCDSWSLLISSLYLVIKDRLNASHLNLFSLVIRHTRCLTK